MSSKLFAFNVSKKVEKLDNQWVGDQIVRASTIGYCTGGQNYGLAACFQDSRQICRLWGGSGYYICDGTMSD